VGSITTLEPPGSRGRNHERQTAGALPTSQVGVGAHGRIDPLFGQTVVIKYGGSAMEKPRAMHDAVGTAISQGTRPEG
jgi:hypothetical protein